MAYEAVWLLDFEFVQPDGNLPRPICCCALDLVSGRKVMLREHELGICPFDVSEKTLFVTFGASAEISCFLQLGWPIPLRVLDLLVEFRAFANGIVLPVEGKKRNLLAALSYFGCPHMDYGEKDTMRALIMTGGPWSISQWKAILAYCWEDVEALRLLLDHLGPVVTATPQRWHQALMRGRYSGAAVARIERTGIPMDTALIRRLDQHGAALKADLIRETDAAFGIFEGSSIRQSRVVAMVERFGLLDVWPRTPATGRFSLDSDALREMAKLRPAIHDLKELLGALSQMRLTGLSIGDDGRNRYSLMPFASITGRNQPSSTKAVFGHSTWERSLILPLPNRPLIYADWSAQEPAIVAALSADPRMLEDVRSLCPYIAFGVHAGRLSPELLKIPLGEAKKIAGYERERLKQCRLGINYGMTAYGLARRLEISEGEARAYIRQHAELYPTFTRWLEEVENRAYLGFSLHTCYGWPLHDDPGRKANTIKNFLVQATGSEILRLACCSATEAGVSVCAPVHDALLSEARPGQSVEDAKGEIRWHMDYASRQVVGFAIKVDMKVIAFPDRYYDGRGKEFFHRVVRLLAKVETSQPPSRIII